MLKHKTALTSHTAEPDFRPGDRSETTPANVSTSGGSAPFAYSWTGPNSFVATSQSMTLNNVQGVNGGVYTVIVTDAKGCTTSCMATLTVASGIAGVTCPADARATAVAVGLIMTRSQ